MIKVLLCGEGPTDYGTPQMFNEPWLDGAVQPIVKKIISGNVDFEKYFGKSPSKPSLPKKPELIWVKEEEPNSDFPKCYLDRVLKQYNNFSSRAVFNNIAHNINIEVLKNNCPISFKRFYNDIQSFNFEGESYE